MNGYIEYTTEHHTNHTVNSTATYSCNEGYALVGDRQRVCFNDNQQDTIGQWSGSAPSCKGKILYHSVKKEKLFNFDLKFFL